jgi:hypothetical protein
MYQILKVLRRTMLDFRAQDEGSSGDEFAGDAGEQEGDDSDFEMPGIKKQGPTRKKVASPTKKSKKSPVKKKSPAKKLPMKKLPATKQVKKASATTTPSRGSQRAAAKSIRYSGMVLWYGVLNGTVPVPYHCHLRTCVRVRTVPT